MPTAEGDNVKAVLVNTGGNHILSALSAFPCTRVGQSPAVAVCRITGGKSHCLANAFLYFFQSSALALPLSAVVLSYCGQQSQRRVACGGKESPLFKLACSVGFLFLSPNTKIALPRNFSQQVNTISNQETEAAAYGSAAAHLGEKNSSESDTAHTWIHFWSSAGAGQLWKSRAWLNLPVSGFFHCEIKFVSLPYLLAEGGGILPQYCRWQYSLAVVLGR